MRESVLPLALLAGLAALVRPSGALAENSDFVLAVLVLETALGLAPERFSELGRRWKLVLALSVVPFVVLAPVAWAIGLLFAGPTREGILALGLAPTEVAAGGLVALAGGDAALVLTAVSGSLVISALAGPLVAAMLADTEGAAGGAGELIVRFALVVVVPLAVGIGTRVLCPKMGDLEPEFSAAGTLTVVVLVYASLSGTGDVASLGPALLGSATFLAVSAVFAVAGTLFVGGAYMSTLPLTIGMRDFAVAAALAGKAFGPPAAVVAGVYGVLVLVAGAAAASVLRHRGDQGTWNPRD